MLAWDSLHPYNAVHVARVPGTPDVERLRTAIDIAIKQRSIAQIAIDRGRGEYSCRARGPTPEIVILDCSKGVRESIAEEIGRQLNTPFDLSGTFSPFRFFVAPGDGFFHLGLSYFHAVADAESIVRLMKDAVENFTGERRPTESANPGQVTPAEKGPKRSTPGVWLRKMAEMPSHLANLRRSCRPSYRDVEDLTVGFALISVDPKKLSNLMQAAKTWRTTVNDVLLALLIKSCATMAAVRATGQRNRISVGCIVNTRKDLAGAARESLGLHLGSFLITQDLPGNLPLVALARNISGVTARIKDHRVYLATALELSAARFLLAFYSTNRQKKLYQKHYPLWGGLTNMNINSLWPSVSGSEPPEYIRAVSTGPVTPLVLSFTTSGAEANIGLSYRTTVFSQSDVDDIESFLLNSLTDLDVA
jgi:hypothetical protein